jgi:glucose/arabinose dehydrogenase
LSPPGKIVHGKDPSHVHGWVAAATLAACLLAAALVPLGAGGATASGTVEGSLLGSYDHPTYVTQAPGDPQLVFVVEQPGRVMLIRNGQPLAQPFLDIRDLVFSVSDPGGDVEQGLLSIAFPPDYQQSGRFYAYFTNDDQAVEVDEFHVSPTDPEVADPASRRQVITIPHSNAPNHNGGQLQFGPNGHLLFFGTGDGGAGQLANARDLTSLLGKLIRIDPLPHGGQPYRIPPSNPYVGVPDRRPEIYAYGLRNPFRFSFDGGRIAIADVGRSKWEEVDMLPVADVSGVNFGWPKYEGDSLFAHNPPGPDPPDPPTFPLFVYPHDGGRCAIIGGYVVHDPSLPSLLGRYIYGDLCTGELRSFIPHVGAQEAVDDAPVGISGSEITTFGEGLAGQIYYAERTGNVYQLVETP